MGENLEKFFKEIKEMGVHPNGSVFYALNNVPIDGKRQVEFFLPIKEEAANLIQTTPPFHVIDKVGKQNFITIKIGYLRKE